MRYGFVIPGGDVGTLVEVAQEIEAAGWDGVFIADAVYGTDPWVSLAAIAVRTERVHIGPLLTPPSRRRPWKLASETATLDRLSNGRVILTVGMGAIDTGFDKVGERTERAVRAELLDESLEIITRFWSGQPFQYEGKHYQITWGPDWMYTPLQRPRIPIWVVGAWPKTRSLQRALRYDGLLAAKLGEAGAFPPPMTPADAREIKQYVDEHRAEPTPFDMIVEGVSPIGSTAEAAAAVRPFADAGATWWIESMWDAPGGLDMVRKRIQQGPPR